MAMTTAKGKGDVNMDDATQRALSRRVMRILALQELLAHELQELNGAVGTPDEF